MGVMNNQMTAGFVYVCIPKKQLVYEFVLQEQLYIVRAVLKQYNVSQ